ncbi:GlxA family transcriptional regulator [Chitinophaga tropicalis]|uniref:Helix-turn-helix domain-containing protein n=1 Tax=Chitinophaga tropicalis TaxID=2683588 RepID=A0A7K1UAR8_9BACT|nr:helix-turn-helix domain-containing protein [Chitinophaga tropicalis]MVT11453.1 helix-turn-helix domain-containing protein [Chitinophaga tropicalis]
MTNLALLLTYNHRLISTAAIIDVFDTVNSFYEASQQPRFFNLQLISANEQASQVPFYGKYTPVRLTDAMPADVVLIPAFSAGDIQSALTVNQAFIPWIKQQHQRGAEIASFCTGAFLLGATGLLNGKPATTHLNACDAFAGHFPDVLLQPDRVLTADAGIYTSGGATSTFHLLLYLVEKYCGRQKAVQAAKLFAIDMDRETQAYFSMFLPEKKHTDPLISEVQQRMEKGFQKPGTVESFVEDIPASRRNFVRRFKQATGITPIEYLQKTRMEAAKRFLEQTDNSILAVMLDCGYNDIKAFRKVFRKEVGLTPTEYRLKFAVNARKPASLGSATV